MRLTPKSAFGQTVLLIGILLLVNQVVSYGSVAYYFIQPSSQQINSLIAKQLHTMLLQDLLKPSKRREEFAKASNIRFYNQDEAVTNGLAQATFYNFMSSQISDEIGEKSDVRVSTDAPYLIWLQIDSYPNLWIVIPMQGITENNFSPLTIVLLVISLLSVIGSYVFVKRMTQPMRALQQAANQVGRGEFPPPITPTGTEEIQDVTKAFNNMAQGIKQLEADRNMMTAGISHDLRTPLTRIRLAAEMLDEDNQWIADGIEHDIEDMNDIINQFIDFARHSRQEEAGEMCNLNDLIEEVVQARHFDDDHTIAQKLQPVPNTKLRKVAIKRVLDNLVENAFRYGSNHLEIYTLYRKKSNFVTLQVRDFGQGIPAEQIDTLSQPFARGDSARGSTGSGLGLAIIKRIVDIHHGKIHYFNHPNGGFVAEVNLPLHKD
jgi:two-component system osmolarity sensor histidine kinase EnvZ